MAKTTVNTMVTKIKRRADHDVPDSDLDNLVIDVINDGLKEIYQDLIDAERQLETGQQKTLTTVANVASVDITTDLADADIHIKVTERTNDGNITIIPYNEFISIYVDPTANKSATPDQCAFFDGKVFFGPTPNQAISIFVDYAGIPADVIAGETLPFKTKYDPILVAMGVKGLVAWLDSKNASGILTAGVEVTRLKNLLIKFATKDNSNRQTQSRRPSIPFFAPRKVIN
ncbi:MAG TPA: hypothetical protein ENI23_06445 [bacterium]|nr:hypothetical protein [bacterium]